MKPAGSAYADGSALRVNRPVSGLLNRPFALFASCWLLLVLVAASARPAVAQAAPAKPATAAATPATPMAFDAESTALPGPDKAVNRKLFAIRATGKIMPGTLDRFRALVRARGITDAIILFDSPGGSADEALAFGKEIRALGFDTRVGARDMQDPGTCAAECVYAFAGGVARFFHAGAQRLGVTGAGKAGPAAAMLDAFLAERGVDMEAYAKAGGAGQGMTWLDQDASEMIGIVNNGSRPPTTRIEMDNGQPMLVIKQQNSDSVAIADFSCGDGGIYATLVAMSTPDTAKYVTGFTSSYVEFDRTDRALEETGEKAGQTRGYGAALVRFLSGAAATRILSAREMIIWLRHPDYEWGAAVTLGLVRPQIAAFFKTCGPGRAAPRQSLPSFDGMASGGGKDLVVAGHHWTETARSLILIDRASIVRSGTSVNVVSYFGARVDGKDVFAIEAHHFDCAAHTGQSSVVYVDRTDTVISRETTQSKAGDPAVELIGGPACDPSLIRQQSVVGDRDPLKLLTRYADSTSDEYP